MQKISLMLILSLIIGIWGCNNPCKDVSCGRGTCENGDCLCEGGWEKDANGSCTIQNFCYNVDCGEHGTCNSSNGDCQCYTGYELNSVGKCDSVSRDKFIGTYNVVGVCPNGTSNYTATILAGNGITAIKLRNYGNYYDASGNIPLEVGALVEGTTLTVNYQDINLNGFNYTVSYTTASLSNNSFSITHTVNGITCISTWTKQ